MEHMTLGQRIQEQRKKLNLSQEALGEALGVSRQAISKWESDLTIPEIDKRIALSKLFNIPVGRLLGVEEPAEEDAAMVEDRTLELAKTIAEGYLAQEGADRRRRGRRGRAVICVAVLLLTAGLTFFLDRRFDRMEGRISSVEGRVSQITGNVDSRINSLAQQLREALEDQDSLVERWDYTVDRVDAWGVGLMVTVVPREYVQGASALLTLRPQGGEAVVVQGEWDGQAFRFPVELREAPEEMRVTLSIEAGGVQVTQELEEIDDLRSRTRLTVSVDKGQETRGWNLKPQNWHCSIELNWTMGAYSEADSLDLRPVNLTLRLKKNGEVIKRQEVPIQQELKGGGYTAEALWEEKITLEQEGDDYALDYWMQDNLGQTYEEEFFHFTVEQGTQGLMAVDQPLAVPADDW